MARNNKTVLRRTLVILLVMVASLGTFSVQAYAAKGWTYQNGDYYYYENNGTMRKNAWASYGGSYYYLGSNGRVATNSWVKYNGAYYYLGTNGRVVTNTWVKYNGAYYYLGSGGKVTVNGWVKYNGSWYYLGADGKMLANTTVKIKNSTYTFAANGKCTARVSAVLDQVTLYNNEYQKIQSLTSTDSRFAGTNYEMATASSEYSAKLVDLMDSIDAWILTVPGCDTQAVKQSRTKWESNLNAALAKLEAEMAANPYSGFSYSITCSSEKSARAISRIEGLLDYARSLA